MNRLVLALALALALVPGCFAEVSALREEAGGAYRVPEPGAAWPAHDVAALESAVGVVQPDAVAALVEARNPDAEAALERWVAALERVPQVTSPPQPMFQYGYSSMFYMHSYGLQQAIPWPGKLLAEGRAALAEARARRGDWREQRNALRARAVASVAELWLARRALELIDENVALVDRFLVTAQARYEAGAVTQSDVLRAEVERGRLVAERAMFVRDVAVGEAALNALLDRPTAAPIGPVPALPPPGAPAPLATLFDAALRGRPALGAAADRVEAADELRSRAEQEWVPDVVVGGAYVRDFRMDEDEVELMGGIELPLWPGRWLGARDEAAANARAARAESRSVVNRVLEEVRAAHARLAAAVERRRALEEGVVPRARQNVEVSEAAYVTGQLGLLELIDAQRMLLLQELELARAVAEHTAAGAALDRAVGR